MRGVMTRPTAGLNEYNAATEINDTFLSDCLDVFSHRFENLYFDKNTSYTSFGNAINGAGLIVTAISDRKATSSTNLSFEDHVVGVLYPNGDDNYLDSLVDITVATDGTSASKTTVDISSYNLDYRYPAGMCLFFTEAVRYVAYCNSSVAKLFVYNYTALETVDLPFYPKKITTYANRIFAIDTGNKLWWCRGGDFRTWYGIPADVDYVVTSVAMKDSGTYTIAAQPPVPMYLSVTVTKTSTIDTLGTIAAVGTSITDAAISETLTPIDGVMYSKYAYKTVTSLTAAGHSTVAGADKITVGVSVVADGIVQADAGVCTYEKERRLTNIAAFSNNLYIFSDDNIYLFSGYSYDTFSSTKIVSDIGANSYETDNGADVELAITNNRCFFNCSGDLYEFDGEHSPKIISHPIIINGQNSNGVLGGITIDATKKWKMVCDRYSLYFYQSYYAAVSGDSADTYIQLYYYMYDIGAKAWWYFSGNAVASVVVGSEIHSLYVGQPDGNGLYNLFGRYISAEGTPTYYALYASLGINAVTLPYIVTKAFNTVPSEDATLTEINLTVKCSETTAQEILVYYSLTENADDFVLLWSNASYIFNGDVETIRIPVLGSLIARQHHYRLKIVVDTSGAVYLYNIERRYRVLGRSR
jgi:hypothetical protein